MEFNPGFVEKVRKILPRHKKIIRAIVAGDGETVNDLLWQVAKQSSISPEIVLSMIEKGKVGLLKKRVEMILAIDQLCLELRLDSGYQKAGKERLNQTQETTKRLRREFDEARAVDRTLREGMKQFS